MTERGLPKVDGAPACPFVAFVDDRETRATSPDHRHRCYAELVPSPRAAAHQEAYCLSSAFPVCPTFQDWARREAAHAAGVGDRPRSAPMAQPEATDGAPDGDQESDRDEAERPRHVPLEEAPIRRNPPRDWAAPPPWAPGGSGAGATRRTGAGAGASGGETTAPGFLAGRNDESRGLVGSAADRLADGPSSLPARAADAPEGEIRSGAPDDELAGLVSGRPAIERPSHGYEPQSRETRRPSVSSTRTSQRERDRDRERDAIVGPSWERARRYEAYPTIRARTGLPAPPRLAILAGALVIAAVALFFLPALLGVGGGGEEATSPAPGGSQAVSTASPAPTATPAPTQESYVIKTGDTLSKVATSFGLTLEELLAANPQITDADKIAAGDEITIPERPPDEFTDPSAAPS